MEVSRDVPTSDRDVILRNSIPVNYKRNVRSMSYCPPPTATSFVQRPQMRPNSAGGPNLVDLMSTESKRALPTRKSKSTVTKPSVPEHHKGRRLSKYLGLHRMSLSGFSSESSKTKNGSDESHKSAHQRRTSKGGVLEEVAVAKPLHKKSSKSEVVEAGPKAPLRKSPPMNGVNDDHKSTSRRFSKFEEALKNCNETEDAEVSENSGEESPETPVSSPDSLNSVSLRKDILSGIENRDPSHQNKSRGVRNPFCENALSPAENIDSPQYSYSPQRDRAFLNHALNVGNGHHNLHKPKQIYSTLSYKDKFDMTCKVVLLGDSGVGKTCLLMKFKDGAFLSGSYISTVGIDFRNKVVNIDGAKVKLQIWDTAGQERFRSVTHAYYRDAHALLLLYDVTSKTSFDNTRAWLAEVHEYAQDDVVIMLIGNKSDAPTSERQIRKEDGERLAREYNVTFMETSAKTGLNVDLAFNAVARDLKARKSDNLHEKNFNVSDYVQKEAKSEPCTCNVG